MKEDQNKPTEAVNPEIEIRALIRDIVASLYGDDLKRILDGHYLPPRCTVSQKRLVCVGKKTVSGVDYFLVTLYRISEGLFKVIRAEVLHPFDFGLGV